jgi:hypothetical protein
MVSPAGPDDLVAVQTWMRRSHVLRFQRWAAQVLAEWDGETSADVPDEAPRRLPAAAGPRETDFHLGQSEARTKYPDAWAAPSWGPGDGPRLAWIRGQASTMTTTLLEALFAAPDGVTGVDLARRSRMEAKSVPGVLRAAADLSRRVDRRPLWDATRQDGTWRYTVPAAVRQLLEQAGE